jgi:hypothetical protein
MKTIRMMELRLAEAPKPQWGKLEDAFRVVKGKEVPESFQFSVFSQKSTLKSRRSQAAAPGLSILGREL